MAIAMTHYVHPTISAYTLPEGPEMSTLPPLTLPQNTVAPTVAFVSPNSSPRETPLSPPPMFSPLGNMSSKIDDVPISSETNTSLAFPVQSDSPKAKRSTYSSGMRLNKFVRRLHDMLQTEQNSGIVEWRRGLLVLHSTDAFAKTILPKYFNTRNFKTFRRQLNYYGFVHVRSFSTTGSSTTALWVNRELAQNGTAKISTVLTLKRVEPCESAKTAEGRRVRKELAVSTVEEDIGVSAKTLQLEQMQTLALRDLESGFPPSLVPSVVHLDPKQNLSSLALLPLTSSITWGETIDNAVSDNSDNDDDAAYLLMMLSKSNARSSPLANMA